MRDAEYYLLTAAVLGLALLVGSGFAWLKEALRAAAVNAPAAARSPVGRTVYWMGHALVSGVSVALILLAVTALARHLQGPHTNVLPLIVAMFALAFLGGHPRSGTTLLEQVLDAHPNVAALDEPGAFLEVLQPEFHKSDQPSSQRWAASR